MRRFGGRNRRQIVQFCQLKNGFNNGKIIHHFPHFNFKSLPYKNWFITTSRNKSMKIVYFTNIEAYLNSRKTYTPWTYFVHIITIFMDQ